MMTGILLANPYSAISFPMLEENALYTIAQYLVSLKTPSNSWRLCSVEKELFIHRGKAEILKTHNVGLRLCAAFSNSKFCKRTSCSNALHSRSPFSSNIAKMLMDLIETTVLWVFSIHNTVMTSLRAAHILTSQLLSRLLRQGSNRLQDEINKTSQI